MPFSFFSRDMVGFYDLVSFYLWAHFMSVYLGQRIIRSLDNRESLVIKNSVSISRNLGVGFFPLAILPAFVIWLAVEPQSLIYRDTFDVEFRNRPLMRLEQLFFFSSCAIIPFMKSSFLRVLALLLCATLYLMIGSRSGPILILIYLIVDRFVLDSKQNWLNGFLLFFSLALLGFTLFLRPSGVGGLVGAIQTFSSMSVSDLFGGLIFSINYIFNYSIVVNGEILAAVPVEARWVMYGLSPLPSFLLEGISEYDEYSRFRVNIPYPGFAYIIKFLGPFLYFICIFMFSIFLALLRRIFINRRSISESLLYMMIFILPVLFALQYNLRTSARFAYLLIVAYFLLGFLAKYRIRWRR